MKRVDIVRRYICCSACGKKMYENDEIFLVDGFTYACCSASCMLYAIQPKTHLTKLDERTVKYFDTKWCIDDSEKLKINKE